MNDATVLVQDQADAQILLDATEEFADWDNMQLNLGKTVVLDADGGSGELDLARLTYKKVPVKIFAEAESCRQLGFWATASGRMSATKQLVVIVFRFSAAHVQWS